MLIYRYLYEISDYEGALRVVSIASVACDDEDSLFYAHLQNTAGACYMEENDLKRSRDAMNVVRDIRERELSSSHPEVAIILGNLGNVESAEGNYEEALELFQKAADIHSRLGDSQVLFLALSWMQMGRVYFLQEKPEDAHKMFQKSENLLQRTGSPNKHYLAQYVSQLLRNDEQNTC
jgi:tetratricopeptide (TPR) repeat protein